MRKAPKTQSAKTWRVALGTRILIGSLAAFMFGIAALMFGLQFASGSSDHSGDWIAIFGGVVVTGFGVFATFALVAISRTRLTLQAALLDATVVEGHNILLVPSFRSFRLPLSDIRSVERRSEIFRTFGVTTTRDAVSIVTTGG